MIIAPLHVKNYCVDDYDDSNLQKLKSTISNPNAHAYKLKCSCGSLLFICFANEHPDFICNCASCGKRIVLYDLSEYPAANKTTDKFNLKQIYPESVQVYPVYEYGDDFYETGADENDITWFSVYILSENKLCLIIDDETA